MGAGEYRVDQRQGAMHGGRVGLSALFYGTNGSQLFLRLDFDPLPNFAHLEVRVKSDDTEVRSAHDKFVAGRVLELSINLADLGVKPEAVAKFQVSLWQSGLPMEALPHSGTFELDTKNHAEWL